MATSLRRPLSTRQADQSVEKLLSPFPCSASRQHNVLAMSKRPRSPEGDDTVNLAAIKKCKTASVLSSISKKRETPNGNALDGTQDTKDRKDRQRLKEQRQNARDEFTYKYTKAFPSFVFFFDERDGGKTHAELRVQALGATVEHFFSASVTHVITNRTQPPKNEQYDPNKEDASFKTPTNKGSVLKSPVQLRTRHDHGGYDKLVRDAVQMNKKIWSVSKLESILSRLLPSSNIANKLKGEERLPPLTQLLQNEKLIGTTLERDPNEKRHDYQYFSKGSYFFLVEDIRNELAPIAIMEYTAPARNSGKVPSYPVLHMDYRARSPFVKYDEREARRQEKLDVIERLKEAEKAKHRAKIKELLKAQHEKIQKLNKPIKRRASMNHLTIRDVNDTNPHAVPDHASVSGEDLSNSLATGKNASNQIASGYGLSGPGGNAYLAASTNSVAITSTTTTSFARTLSCTTRLPPNLRERLGHQVVMSRRLEANKENQNPRLRKSKSTTTMKLPAREETKKPGYCEACRVKFENFNTHVRGARHTKFARNENNYIDLDYLLRRLERKPALPESPDATSPAADSDDQGEPSDGYLGPGDYFYDLQMDDENEPNVCTPDHQENNNIDGDAAAGDGQQDAYRQDDKDGENLTIPLIITIDESDS